MTDFVTDLIVFGLLAALVYTILSGDRWPWEIWRD